MTIYIYDNTKDMKEKILFYLCFGIKKNYFYSFVFPKKNIS